MSKLADGAVKLTVASVAAVVVVGIARAADRGMRWVMSILFR